MAEEFGRAVFVLEAENRQYVDTLRQSEQIAKTSAGTITKSFNSVRVSSESVTRSFQILGPAMSALGGSAGAALGPLVGLGSAISSAGSALLGLPAIALAAVSAIGLVVNYIRKQRDEAKAAAEEAEKIAEEARKKDEERRKQVQQQGAQATVAYVADLVKQRDVLKAQSDEIRRQREDLKAINEVDKVQLATQRELEVIEKRRADYREELERGRLVGAAAGGVGMSRDIFEQTKRNYEDLEKYRIEVIAAGERRVAELKVKAEQEELQRRKQIEKEKTAIAEQEAAKREAAVREREARIAAGNVTNLREAFQYVVGRVRNQQQTERSGELIDTVVGVLGNIPGLGGLVRSATGRQRAVIQAASAVTGGGVGTNVGAYAFARASKPSTGAAAGRSGTPEERTADAAERIVRLLNGQQGRRLTWDGSVMATVREVRYSREGYTESLTDPPSGYSRTFDVDMDERDDNPVETLINTPVQNTNENVVLGSPHPWNTGTKLTAVSPVEKMTDTRWIVIALYTADSLVIATWNGWIPSMRTGDVFTRIYDALPTYKSDTMPFDVSRTGIIGPGGSLLPNQETKRYGVPQYNAVEKAEDSTHYCYNERGDVVYLKRNDLVRNETGYDYPIPIANLTLSKTVYALNMPSSWHIICGNYKNKVNNRTWFSYPAGRVMFTDAAVTPTQATFNGASGVAWLVELYFLISFGLRDHQGFQGEIHTKDFTAQGGGLKIAPVFQKEGGALVKEYFKVRHQADLNGLLHFFP